MKNDSVFIPDKSKPKMIYLGYTDMLDLLIQEFRNCYNFKDKITIINKFIELAKIVSTIDY